MNPSQPTPPPVPWLESPDTLGTLPAWISGILSGISVILALSLFIAGRRSNEREQIDKCAIWLTTKYQRQFMNMDGIVERINEIQYQFHYKNANDVPMDIHQVAVELRTNWLLPVGIDDRYDIGEPYAWRTVPGIDKTQLFFGRRFLEPGVNDLEEWRTIDVAHHAPESASQLTTDQGVDATVSWFIGIDNAGRRWECRPGVGKRARRIRWYSRRNVHYPSTWKSPLFRLRVRVNKYLERRNSGSTP